MHDPLEDLLASEGQRRNRRYLIFAANDDGQDNGLYLGVRFPVTEKLSFQQLWVSIVKLRIFFDSLVSLQ